MGSYDQIFHDQSNDVSSQAAREVLPYLIDLFKPASYIELGAGYGHWAQTALDLGLSDVLAVDGPWTDLAKIRVPRENFLVHELGVPLETPRRYDMALSLEVGEHLPATAAATLVQSLVDAADIVVFGAATPLQGGHLHINEQWQSYWRDLFADRDYVACDLIRHRFWSNRSVIYYYKQNALVYLNAGRQDLLDIAEREARSFSPIMDFVHPEKYVEMANYDVVLSKRLARKLPGHVWRIVLNRLSLRH